MRFLKISFLLALVGAQLAEARPPKSPARHAKHLKKKHALHAKLKANLRNNRARTPASFLPTQQPRVVQVVEAAPTHVVSNVHKPMGDNVVGSRVAVSTREKVSHPEEAILKELDTVEDGPRPVAQNH